MDRSVRALQSFCADEEAWIDHWAVTGFGRGVMGTMPGVEATETVGLTDRRLLWLDDDLETVALGAVDGIVLDEVDYRSAPWLVRVGAMAMVVGVTIAAALAVLKVQFVVAVVPAALGILVFLIALAAALGRGDGGDAYSSTRLRLDTADGEVIVWGDPSVVEDIAGAVSEEAGVDLQNRR